MAERILGRSVPEAFSRGSARKGRIASSTTGRRYRAACRRAERYARLYQLARRIAVFFFLVEQALWPVRRFLANAAYQTAGVGLGILSPRPNEAALQEQGDKPVLRPLNLRKLYIRINTFLAFLAFGIAFFTLATYRMGLEVTLDGKSIGYVANQDVVEESLTLVADAATEILGYPYSPNYDLEYQFSIVNHNAIFDRQETVESLLMQIPEVGRLYVLRVDGETVGAAENKAVIDDVLEEILMTNAQKVFSKEPEILNSVTLRQELTNRDLIRTAAQFKTLLTANRSDEIHYTVRWGDTAESVAASFGLSADVLQSYNPDTDLTLLTNGQTLLVKKAKPLLTISYEEKDSYLQSLPYQTEYLEDDTLWVGETKLLSEGENGSERVYTLRQVTGGYAEPAEIAGRQVVKESTNRVIRVGIKERVSTGSFIRPTNGRLTSNYGYRVLFGRRDFHSGIDYASPVGTPIAASDGGVVIQAGYSGTYGLLIVVDHGNGFVTYYAHCSKLTAQVGQTVGQGEIIARVGNTGRSTGPHVHFEMRKNGTRVNPAHYLK